MVHRDGLGRVKISVKIDAFNFDLVANLNQMAKRV